MKHEEDLIEQAERWRAISEADVAQLAAKEREYQSSWRRRGGTGAFENLCRKWDRLQAQAERCGRDVFRACAEDQRPEGILDDLGDLRRYLLLTEAWVRTQVLAEAEADQVLAGLPRSIRDFRERLEEAARGGALPAEACPPADPQLAQEIRDAIVDEAVQQRNQQIQDLRTEMQSQADLVAEQERALTSLAELLHRAKVMLAQCEPAGPSGWGALDQKRRALVQEIDARLTPEAARGL